MSEKREQIIQAAVRATKHSGLRSVSFRQLANEVGVKSASVHYHFATKPDLAESMVRSYTEQFEVALGAIEHSQSTLKSKLDALIDIFAAVLEDGNLCLCGMMAAELSALDERTQWALRHFFTVAEKWLQKQIEQHHEELRLELTPEALSRVMFSGLEGAILRDRVDQRSASLDAYRQLVQAIVT